MVQRHLLLFAGAGPRPIYRSRWGDSQRGTLPNVVTDLSVSAIRHFQARYIAAAGSGDVALVSRGDPLSHPERWKLD